MKAPLYAAVLIALFVVFLALAGCAQQPLAPIDPKLYPSGTAYIYQPINPTTVWVRGPTEKELKAGDLKGDETSNDFKRALLRDLDTETIRISLTTITGDSKSTVGIVGVSVEGQSYVLIVDYIKYVTNTKALKKDYLVVDAKGNEEKKRFEGRIPIYTGIGLRIRAEFQALKGGLNISGLPALAIAANSNAINGRLTVQTLGITGKEITGLMPLISDISVTSIQNAIQGVAAIKAKIYDDSTTVFPKIVGFESPDADNALIRALIAALYESEEYICPLVSEVKNLEGKTQKILWIRWDAGDGKQETKAPETAKSSDATSGGQTARSPASR